MGFVDTHILRVDTRSDQLETDEGLRQFWELESMGINPIEESVHARFTREIKFRDGRYEVSLPWRESHPKLPENYELCVNRLHSLYRRLQRDPELLEAYDGVIREQLQNGIIEEVLESQEPHDKAHYLPHHPVIRRDKSSTKVRVVYDASCSQGISPSLNQCLHIGPSFGQCILDVLIRFRMHKVALVGDVEKAFLMVSITERDRDALHFLWFNDVSVVTPTLIKYRFTRVVFGMASSPFLLNATLRHHIERYEELDPTFVSKFIRGIYVDDVTTGAVDENACYEFYLKSKIRLSEAGFNLRKFISNSPSLIRRIVANERKINGEPCNPQLEADHKVLGVPWNPSNDEMIFDITPVVQSLEALEPTKRRVVGTATRVYDPMGILSPITIQFKLFFQCLCSAKLDWDDQLTDELLDQWRRLVSRLNPVKPVMVPRVPLGLKGAGQPTLQLIGFCDASQMAYAAVVYLRATIGNDSTLTLLTAKTQVAPLKTVTIPRLELLSALLLARLINTVSCALENEVKLNLPVCFTDSKIALCWVRHDTKEWKQFVENRVCEIRKLVPTQCWQHCPGVQNPADLPSRGLSCREFEDRLEFWLKGPCWLKEPLNMENSSIDPIPDECLSEMRRQDQTTTTLSTTAGQVEGASIVTIEHFSSLRHLLRVVAWVYCFVRRLRFPETREGEGLLAKDVEKAHNFLIRAEQVVLRQNTKFRLWRRQFGLFEDKQGVLRCGGRLSNAGIPCETANPIFLEKRSYLTHLIVKDCHERMKHGGVSSTLAELRSKYWVVQGRQLTKQVIYHCILCRRFQGKSYKAPPPPPLPLMRVDEKPPFTYTGVDFAGPLYTRETLAATSRKVWLCLYTCCVTWAVHIELVTEMKATAFLRSFKRFTARRGVPVKMLSDNGKTFKAADKWIATVMKHPSVCSYWTENRISWRFNVEKAPWWGGVFEWMIQSMKTLLR